eukprot:17739-Rhodomonas_salina.1
MPLATSLRRFIMTPATADAVAAYSTLLPPRQYRIWLSVAGIYAPRHSDSLCCYTPYAVLTWR